ncbi:hypothetical protein BDZ89DRAFT_1115855 [Hymenopellis radicata]|nr:hypothetical protein BDZ89DRAFT_1115855 [Hymenopellis radicata]
MLYFPSLLVNKREDDLQALLSEAFSMDLETAEQNVWDQRPKRSCGCSIPA